MKIINSYIAKIFLIKFTQICGGFSLLIFFINFLDASDKAQGSDVPFYIIILMAFLQIPDFLNDVISSLLLISAIITFFLLSSKSEITIIRSGGFSLWQVLRPVSLSAFLLGVFWVVVFIPLSIEMLKKFNAIERKYIRGEIREVVAPNHGIWFRQANLDNPNEELIIRARKIYEDKKTNSLKRKSAELEIQDIDTKPLEFEGVVIWFFDKDGKFYKKINAERMFMSDSFWLAKEVVLNDDENLNKKVAEVLIPTELQKDFVRQKVVNNFQNVKLFSPYQLPSLIKDLESAGFSSTKFKVYFHSLLSKPLLFLAMTLISCYFGLNHIRYRNTILMIFLGIITGLIFYVISGIVNAFGSSGLISVFASTWMITIVCLAFGILMIYRKENF